MQQTLEGFRLSPQQKRLWLQSGDRQVYSARLVLQIDGDLQIKCLKNALDRVIERHDILRTNFHRQPGLKVPIQVIQSSNRVSFDLEVKNNDWQSSWQKQQQTPFEYERGRLLHAELIRHSDRVHYLVLALSALCSDRESLKTLTADIAKAYCCEIGEEIPSDEAIQYLQFSEWQHELLEEDAEEGLTYWQQQDLDDLPELKLPFEKRSPESNCFSPDVYSVDLETQIADRLHSIAQQYQTSIDIVLLACWQTFLWRITQQDDIVVGTISHGRQYEELADAIGLLAKSLPIRCHFSRHCTLGEIITRIDRVRTDAEQWQEYWTDNCQSNPNSIGFEWFEWPEPYRASHLSFSWLQQSVRFEPFKLQLLGIQTANTVSLEFHYNSHRLAQSEIQRLAAQFCTLLASATQDPNQQIDEFNLLHDRDRHQLLVEFNRTQTDFPPPQCIHRWFETQVEQTPHQTAVIDRDRTLTYTELNARANQIARTLQRRGIQPEALVGLYVERSPAFIIGILAIWKAGGAYVPIDPSLPPAAVKSRLRDNGISVLLAQASLADPLANADVEIIDLDRPSHESTDNPDSPATSANLAYGLFTSGSTGKPKGVAIEHRQLFNYIQAILARLDLPRGAHFALVSTFAADLGNTAIFPALCSGGCLHIIPEDCAADPVALSDYVRRHPIDCLKIVPSHLSALLAAGGDSSLFPRQWLVLGGEAVSWSLVEQIRQHRPPCRLLDHYGPTETTVGVLTYEIDCCRGASRSAPTMRGDTVPIGTPLPNLQVYILDARAQPVPIGVAGELYIGGAGVSRGYLHQPEATAARFVPHPFARGRRLYRTGDRARYWPDGTIEFLGRNDYQVKIRGFRVELEEIEAILTQHPGVRQAVVVVWEGESSSARLAAYFIAERHNAPTPATVREFLAQRLSDYAIPATFVRLQRFPLTPNGKVDRRALAQSEWAQADSQATYVAPRSPLERQLADIWADVLDIDRAGIHDNFFELGGHSLLLTQLLFRLREALGADLSLPMLFEAPTVAELAAILDPQSSARATESGETDALLRDARLDETIRPDGEVRDGAKAILLTGATGFLGAFLLAELLEQTAATIYCLVRSPDVESGFDKIETSLKSYLVWDEAYRDRVVPVVGDLSQPHLGLDESQFQSLAGTIDRIYHNGARVHHASPYRQLRAANVLGTQEILRLACTSGTKPVHLISTTSVFNPAHRDGDAVIREGDPLEVDRIPSGGYAQSKWVAERLVSAAGDRGLPVCIYRPGRICAHAQTGAFNPNDFLYRSILACIQLGSVPVGDVEFDLVPVDYVSRAIVYLSEQRDSWGQTFHLVNRHWLGMDALIDSIRDFGYPVRQIPYPQWRERLLQVASDDPDRSLSGLAALFGPGTSDRERSRRLRFDDRNAISRLHPASIVCPSVDTSLVQTYLSRLVRQGVLAPPARTHSAIG